MNINISDYIQEMSQLARAARNNAYTPYSGFMVGAALLCEDGKIFTGCNIENAAYSPSICAERVAIFKAISEGHTQLAAILICAAKKGERLVRTPPCGVCRQVMAEFCEPNFEIILIDDSDIIIRTTLSKLLPLSFDKTNLEF